MTGVDTLKPCPFCGGKSVFVSEEAFFGTAAVLCSDCCTVHGYPSLETNEEAIDAWNTRTDKDDEQLELGKKINKKRKKALSMMAPDTVEQGRNKRMNKVIYFSCVIFIVVGFITQSSYTTTLQHAVVALQESVITLQKIHLEEYNDE